MVNWIKNGIPFVYFDATWIESTLLNDSICHFISRLSRACSVRSHKIDIWFLGGEDKCFSILSRINVDNHAHPRYTCPWLWLPLQKCRTQHAFLLKDCPFNGSKCQFASFIFIVHQTSEWRQSAVKRNLWLVFDSLGKIESFLLWRSVAPEGNEIFGKKRRRVTSMNRIFHLGAFNSTWSASQQMSIHFIEWCERHTVNAQPPAPSQPVRRHRVTNRV